MSDQTETRPDPQERVKVRFNDDPETERTVRRCTLKHMAEGWRVVDEKDSAPEGGEAGDSGSGNAGGSGGKKGRSGGQQQEG